MAAIEKVCELSDEYPSYDMYRMKRNHIQVCSKFRKLFRGAQHTLYIFKPNKKLKINNSWVIDIPDSSVLDDYFPPFVSMEEYIAYFYKKYRIIDEHWFMLEVYDDELQGRVNGQYCNYTFELSKVKRKLKRMLRCKNLNIVYVDEDFYEWRQKKFKKTIDA